MSNPPSAHPTPYEDDASSFPSRVLQSASSLARTLVSDSNPRSATATLVNSANNREKAGPSSGRAGLSSTLFHDGVGVTSGGITRRSGNTEEEASFRENGGLATTYDGSNDVRHEMNAFTSSVPSMQDSTTVISAPNEKFPYVLESTWKGKAGLKNVDHKILHETWTETFRTEGEDLIYTNSTSPKASTIRSDIQTAEAQDGADVLALLQTSGSLTAPETLQTEIDDSTSVSADDLFATPESPSVIAKYKADLPPRPLPRPSPLGLADHAIILRERAEPVDLDKWLKTWHEMTRNYTDEVWGPDREVVKEVEREVERIEKEPERKWDGRAVERLRAILGHLGNGAAV